MYPLSLKSLWWKGADFGGAIWSEYGLNNNQLVAETQTSLNTGIQKHMYLKSNAALTEYAAK